MTKEKIAEIRARCGAAIPGPWETKKLGYDSQQTSIYQGPVKKVNGGISYIGRVCNMEGACKDFHEDAMEYCDVESLQNILDEWAEQQSGTETYFPDFSVGVILKNCKSYIEARKEEV